MNLPQGWKMNETAGGWILTRPDGVPSVPLPNRWLVMQMYLRRIPFEANHNDQGNN